jgi:hypothetical protein
MENLTTARLIKVKTYDPAPEHAEVAFHSLSKSDKMRALTGKDERNFPDYDMLPVTSASNQEAQARLDKAPAREVEGATKAELKKDFKAMGIKWVEPDRGRPKRGGRSLVDEEDEEFWSDPFEDRVVKKSKAKRKVADSVLMK